MSHKIYSAEYVLPGHPDKIADQIADALVQEAARLDRRALCGVEVAVHRESVFVTGRIACEHAETIDIPAIVRLVYRNSGYGKQWLPDPDSLQVRTDLCRGLLNDGESEFRAVADDQNIVVGYAVDLPATNYLPLEHWLVGRLARRFEVLTQQAVDLQLGPDGKLLVVLEGNGQTQKLLELSISLQQSDHGSSLVLQRKVDQLVQKELQVVADLIPTFSAEPPKTVTVNGAGNFVVGGPIGDNGLSGKKLVVDAYGPRVPIGGGALSGKDFFKADRAGAILARRLAKAVVLTGAAREATVHLGFIPGNTSAHILSIVNEEGNCLATERWSGLFDLTLQGVGDRFGRFDNLLDIARYGHFTEPSLPWEQVGFDSGSVLVNRPASA